MAERPLGITILSILGFLGGFLEIIGGIMLLALGAFMVPFIESLGFLGSIAGILLLTIILVIIGIVQFVASYGLWKMQKWGYYIEMIMFSIGIVFAIISLALSDFSAIITIVIYALILYYLYSKRKLFS